jgi:hypothetical protein
MRGIRASPPRGGASPRMIRVRFRDIRASPARIDVSMPGIRSRMRGGRTRITGVGALVASVRGPPRGGDARMPVKDAPPRVKDAPLRVTVTPLGVGVAPLRVTETRRTLVVARLHAKHPSPRATEARLTRVVAEEDPCAHDGDEAAAARVGDLRAGRAFQPEDHGFVSVFLFDSLRD